MNILTLVVLCISSESLFAQPCVWPEFFDLSYNGPPSEDEARTWETEAKMDTEDDLQAVNWYMKSKKEITIQSNDTLKILESASNGQGSVSATYVCEKILEDNKIVLKKTIYGETYFAENVDPPLYRCVQLIEVSKYVLRWRVGDEAEQIPDCIGEFAPISPSPLVYFPVRDAGDYNKIFRKHNILRDYPECPPLGGFQMRVFDAKGQDVCRNDDPSPVMEMECAKGEGLRFLPSEKSCRQYTFARETGSKLNCLGHWNDGKYIFIVLLPNGKLKVNGFHCLRINKDDPTKEKSVLFLDQVCKHGPPEAEDNYLILNLRRRIVNEFCDDSSDQCQSRKCGDSNYMRYSCMTTCESCPTYNGRVPSDVSIRGTWVFQKTGERKEVKITEKDFTIMDMGTFKAYGTEISDKCIGTPAPLKNDLDNTFSYSLARVGDQHGCGPRVTQFRARLIGQSVLLMQAAASSPLRANKHASNPKTWCENNNWDAESFSPLFTPNAPYANLNGLFPLPDSYFTLVRKDAQSGSCNLDKNGVGNASHMKVTIKFKHKEKEYTCEGETHVNYPNKWKLVYSCKDGLSGDILFDCLELYDVNTDYYSLVLRAPASAADDVILPLNDEYFCLILPKRQDEKYGALLSTAGECDLLYANEAFLHNREAIIRMTDKGFICGCPGLFNSVTALIVIIMAFYCTLY